MAVVKTVPENIKKSLWCPGCGYGIAVRLIQEVMREKGLLENNVGMIGVGCSTNIQRTVKGGNKVECHHGRAPVSARALKALLPDTVVWTFQGDGDAFSIGMAETILAAQGDYPITVFVINNNNYGMTGGQMAQTTLQGQITTTSQKGRDGVPFNVIPMLATIDHVAYAARGTVTSVPEINKLKKYISKALDVQIKQKKYAFVEILSPCPTNWNKTPLDACEWIMSEVVKDYPLGEFINKTEG